MGKFVKVLVPVTAVVFATLAAPLAAHAAPGATPTNLIVKGQVVSARASYTTSGSGSSIETKTTLSSVTPIGSAWVELAWWPSSTENGSDFKPGDKVSTVVIGRTQADASGRYAVSGVPTADMVAAAKQNDGWINLVMTTYSGADFVLEGISRHWDGGQWTEFGAERPGMSPTASHQNVFATDKSTGERKYGTDPQQTGRLAQMAVDPATVSSCYFLPGSYFDAWSTIVEFHNVFVADGNWEYGQTADSDVELGISYDGTHGSVSGTVHAGNTATASVGFNTSSSYGRYAQSSFRYEQGLYYCAMQTYPYVRVNRWNGSGVQALDSSPYTCAQAPQSGHKLWQIAGSNFTKNTSRSFKYGARVTFYGISLGITSGFSSWVKLHWNFTRGAAYLCGNNDLPAYAQIVYTS